MLQMWLVDKTAVLILALPRLWLSREEGLERPSRGKGKRNVAGRGWVERNSPKEWGEARGK